MRQLKDMTEPELASLMKHVAKQIELIFSLEEIERPLFALLLFNDPEVAQYIANCDRQTIIQAMRETADRLEQRQYLPR